MTYKTILAPNAPWPSKPVEQPKPVAKKRVAPKPKDPSKIKQTDEMFQQWAARNLGVNT